VPIDLPIYLSGCPEALREWIAADEERIAAALNIDTPAGGRE
jgi:hypothetical protein